MSLSTRRAWIEIEKPVVIIPVGTGRSPHGERGLKCSLSLRASPAPGSLSTRRAWIEISLVKYSDTPTARRSPHGERGLKSPYEDVLKDD